MLKRQLLIGVAASLLVASGSAAGAQEVLKLGLVLSMTGAFNTAGKAVGNQRFNIGFTDQQKRDLVNFLNTL